MSPAVDAVDSPRRMTLLRVARMAGVSGATVSRVLNKSAGVDPTTAQLVQKVVSETGFVLRERKPSIVGLPRRRERAVQRQVVFVCVGYSADAMPPGFFSLLQGIERGVAAGNFGFTIASAVDPSAVPETLIDASPSGLLLTGRPPVGKALEFYRRLPSVWLMANRQRPTFGDQVMPDSEAIGRIAAEYLLGRGHKQLAFVEAGPPAWFMESRWAAFDRATRIAGAAAHHVLPVAPDIAAGLSEAELASHTLDQLLALQPRPTGVFVLSDRELAWIQPKLMERGLKPGRDIDIISCNNERSYLAGLDPMPATIDIRPSSIGETGVHWLQWRIDHRDAPGKITTTVEPLLVPGNSA